MDSTVPIVILIVLFLLALVASALFLYVYWWQIQRPSPKLEGKVHLVGGQGADEQDRGSGHEAPSIRPALAPEL